MKKAHNKSVRSIGMRRSMVLAAAALASAAVAPSRAFAFVKGADISWAQQMEATGRYWKGRDGVKHDIVPLLKSMGVNTIRLRTWVNPSSDPANGHCSQPETIRMAQRCAAVGLHVYIDFHYGDTWNSVGSQNPPAAWKNYSYSQMKSAIYSYTYNFLVALKNAGVTPEFCSPGNEVNSGICHPVGSISYPTQMTGCIMAGYNAIKAVFPNCKVIIHVAQIQNSGATAMLDAYKANGGKWDVTGFSSYATGSNVPMILTKAGDLVTRYGKPVMQVEFGEDVSQPTQSKTDLQNFITGMKNLGANGLGNFWWEPEGYANWGDMDTSTAWSDSTLEPTIALDPFATN